MKTSDAVQVFMETIDGLLHVNLVSFCEVDVDTTSTRPRKKHLCCDRSPPINHRPQQCRGDRDLSPPSADMGDLGPLKTRFLDISCHYARDPASEKHEYLIHDFDRDFVDGLDCVPCCTQIDRDLEHDSFYFVILFSRVSQNLDNDGDICLP